NRKWELHTQAGRAVGSRDQLMELRRDLVVLQKDVQNLRDAQDDPRLELVSAWIGEEQPSVDAQLKALDTQERERVRLRDFDRLRQEAQFDVAGLGVLDPSERPRPIGASAHAALTLYAADPGAPVHAWTLVDPLPAALSAAEQERVRDGCYDLLLMASQA